MLRQYQSIHFDLLDFFKKRLVVMVNECAYIVKDGNMWPADKSLRNLLRFTRRHCLQLFLLFRNKKFFSVQSSKKSYLKLRLSLDISFLVTLEFHQFDDKLCYVVLRTSLSFQGLPMYHFYDNDVLNLISGFREMLWQPSERLLFLHIWKHSNTMQHNTTNCVVWHTLSKATVKIFRFTQYLALMKHSFRESLGVAELKMVF